MKRTNSYKVTNRKRKREISPDKIDENIKSSKKCKSDKTTKKTKLIDLKEVNNFMACIDDKYEGKIFDESNKLTGDELNFDYRKDKSISIIKGIVNNKKLLDLIKESLKYDNTNKNIIYKLLEYYYNEKDEKKFMEEIDKYKFCITKKLNIIKDGIEQLIDLDNLFKINILIEEYEELGNHEINCENITDIRNSLVDIYTGYCHTAKYIYEFQDILSKKDLEDILTCKYTTCSEDNSKFILNYERDKKLEILSKYDTIKIETSKELLDKIECFLCRYILYKEFTFFDINQPIDFKHNLSLYYNYVIFYLYDTVVQVEQLSKKIILKKSKLNIYHYLMIFHDILFDNYFDKKEEFNITMDHLMKYFLLILSSETAKDYRFLLDYIHLKKIENFIDNNSAVELINKINEKDKLLKANIKNDKIIFDEKGKKSNDIIEIKFENYSNTVLSYAFSEYNWIWEKINFTEFQNRNFFLEKDIDYLKYLIRKILSSKLFKDIFNNYNNVSDVAEYYFNNSKNIDDYINRIIFLPFSAGDLNKHGYTERKLLYVAVSGFPQKRIHNLKEYRIYRILELALRSIVLGDHEPCHFIKSAYSIITSSIIKRNTTKDNSLDSGFFMEEVLFGWKAQENFSLPIELPKDLICENKSLQNKHIDLITAILLLNPSIYDNELFNFRKILFQAKKSDLKTFSFNSITDLVYKNYLQSILDEETIHELSDNEDYSINASMKANNNFSIGYIRCNHNLGRTENIL